MKIARQKSAVAFALSLDSSSDSDDVTEYQYGRHEVRGVKLWNANGGYAVALKPGKKMPESFAEYGPWSMVRVPGWDVYFTNDAGNS